MVGQAPALAGVDFWVQVGSWVLASASVSTLTDDPTVCWYVPAAWVSVGRHKHGAGGSVVAFCSSLGDRL